MTAGRILYLCYHRPKGALRKFIYVGGRRGERLSQQGREEMESAAYGLVADSKESSDASASLSNLVSAEQASGKIHPLQVHTLAGRKHWFMVAFMLSSLRKQISRPLQAHVYDDGGGLDAEQKRVLGSLGVDFVFHEAAGVETAVRDNFPEKQFPWILRLAERNIMLRKVLGPHAGAQAGPKLYIDADILFFRQPSELTSWFDDPHGVLCAKDLMECYGYPREMLDRLAGVPLPSLVNAGITGMCTEWLDWERIEHWCGELVEKFGENYYLEQALVATVAARVGLCQLEPARYLTLPTKKQIQQGSGVAQHYVDISRHHYFRTAWRRFASLGSTAC
jgi:hypothetical protein